MNDKAENLSDSLLDQMEKLRDEHAKLNKEIANLDKYTNHV